MEIYTVKIALIVISSVQGASVSPEETEGAGWGRKEIWGVQSLFQGTVGVMAGKWDAPGLTRLAAGANGKARTWQHAVESSQHIAMHPQEMAVITSSNFLFHLMAINPSFLHPGHFITKIRHCFFFQRFFGTLFGEKINSSTSSSP